MKKKLLLFASILFLLSLQAVLAADYGDFPGSFEGLSDDADGNPQYLQRGDTFFVSLDVNCVIDDLPTFAKFGFLGSTDGLNTLDDYMKITSDDALKNIAIAETEEFGVAESEFYMFYVIRSSEPVNLSFSLKSSDGTVTKLKGETNGDLLDWTGTINGKTISSDGTAEDTFHEFTPSEDSVVAYDFYPVEIRVTDYYSAALDVYKGYLSVEASTV